jgi:hypothetical protein
MVSWVQVQSLIFFHHFIFSSSLSSSSEFHHGIVAYKSVLIFRQSKTQQFSFVHQSSVFIGEAIVFAQYLFSSIDLFLRQSRGFSKPFDVGRDSPLSHHIISRSVASSVVVTGCNHFFFLP